MWDVCQQRVILWMAGVSLLISGCGSDSTPTERVAEKTEVIVSTEPAPEPQPTSTKSAPQVKPQQNSPAKPESLQPITAAPPEPRQPEKLYRPSDTRPVHNNERLALLGIHCYESPRLKLYTDIDPEIAKRLPAVIDEAYPALEKYFGPLPPNREGTEFQVTGYIMQDRELFKKAGLIINSLLEIINGRHLKAQFWMEAQSEEYYQRHLMLHEYTHCYSMIMENIGAPVWYLEGIAESIATHSYDQDGKIRLNVIPDNKNKFGGLGRITLIEEDVLAGPPKSMYEVMSFQPSDFIDDTRAYAWSWALCQFFDKHPQYQQQFRELSRHLQGLDFAKHLAKLTRGKQSDLNAAWLLFAKNLMHGYDVERATVSIEPGLPLASGTSQSVTVLSNRGWQSSRVGVEKGETYEISAEGMVTLAQQPKPWESTADGISFRYFKGRPLGRLIMLIKPAEDADDLSPMLQEYPLGANATWMAPVSGTIYFRLNDSWDELADNRGQVTVKIDHKADLKTEAKAQSATNQ